MSGASSTAAPPVVYSQGFCEHPVQLLGTPYDTNTGEILGSKVHYVSCGNRRFSHCVACSERYGLDAWHVLQSGLKDADKPALFLTLTAPGMGVPRKAPQGELGDDGTYIMCPHHSRGKCSSACRWGFHKDDDKRIGSPIFPAKFDYERAVSWNNASSDLWADFMRRWRKLSKSSPAYLVVREFQARGLIHFHCLTRGTADQAIIKQAFRSARAYADGYEHRFGSRRDEIGLKIELLPAGAIEPRRKVSGYLTKYLCKSLAHELQSSGALATHYGRMRDEAVTMADRRRAPCTWAKSNEYRATYHKGARHRCDCPACGSARRYRSRAYEMMGFTGHVLSKSSAHGSKWGKTFGECRAERTSFNAKRDDTALAMEWAFVRSGWDRTKRDERKRNIAAEYRASKERAPPTSSVGVSSV